MAGRTQQYLRTEYIQPPANLPTLDATKCPLALLAQTCSAIGKDVGSKSKFQSSASVQAAKYIQHPENEKRKSRDSTMSGGEEHYERGGNSSPDDKRPSQVAAAAERLSVSSPNPRSSIKRKSPELPTAVSSSQQQAKKTRRDERFSPSSSPVQMNRADSRESRLSSPNVVSQNGHKELSASPKSHSPKCPPTTHTTNKLPSPLTSGPVPPNSMSYHTPNPLAPPTSSCYDGLKTAAASQIPAYLSFPNPAGPYSLYAQMMAAAANRTSPTSAPAVDSLSHACNWVSRETGTCGKRFSTAEELFTHLRSHAVSNNVMPASYMQPGLDKLSTSPYASYVNQQAAALAAISSSMPSQMGMNFLSNAAGYNPLSRYPSFKNSPLLNGPHPGLSPLTTRTPGMSPFWSPFVLNEPMFDARALSYI